MHPLVYMKRASRSLTKTVFLRFPQFLAREGFQVEVYVGPMLELVLGAVLERSWSDLGRFLGGQDGPKTPTKRIKTATRRPKTRP